MSGMQENMMARVTELAARKRHHLAKDMVDGSKTLTPEAAAQVLRHLEKCPDLPAGEVRVNGREQIPGAPSLPPLAAFTDIPPGYYATESRTGHNDFDFWFIRIDKPSKGQWAGRTFIHAKRVLGGGDGTTMRTEQLSNVQERLALLAIRETGTEESGMLFAAQIRRCRACGLPLTDEISRSVGMGPTCRNKKG